MLPTLPQPDDRLRGSRRQLAADPLRHSISLALARELCPELSLDAAFSHLEAGSVAWDGERDDADHAAVWANWRF